MGETSPTPAPGGDRDDDRIEQLVKFAGLLGMNTVRVRWKLLALEKRYQGWRLRAGRQAEHIRYAHKVCRQCGRELAPSLLALVEMAEDRSQCRRILLAQDT